MRDLPALHLVLSRPVGEQLAARGLAAPAAFLAEWEADRAAVARLSHRGLLGDQHVAAVRRRLQAQVTREIQPAAPPPPAGEAWRPPPHRVSAGALAVREELSRRLSAEDLSSILDDVAERIAWTDELLARERCVYDCLVHVDCDNARRLSNEVDRRACSRAAVLREEVYPLREEGP